MRSARWPFSVRYAPDGGSRSGMHAGSDVKWLMPLCTESFESPRKIVYFGFVCVYRTFECSLDWLCAMGQRHWDIAQCDWVGFSVFWPDLDVLISQLMTCKSLAKGMRLNRRFMYDEFLNLFFQLPYPKSNPTGQDYQILRFPMNFCAIIWPMPQATKLILQHQVPRPGPARKCCRLWHLC